MILKGNPSWKISIHQPTEFVRNHQGDFLPDWNEGVESVIIVLQQASLRLIGDYESTQKEKDVLYTKLVDFGRSLREKLESEGFLLELMNPITGKAMFSRAGIGCHDDIRVVSELLGVGYYDLAGCRVLVHEEWGEAVYPGVLMSSAKRDLIESVIEQIFATHSPLSYGGVSGGLFLTHSSDEQKIHSNLFVQHTF